MWQETIIKFDKVDKQGDIFQTGCFDLTQTGIPLVRSADNSHAGVVHCFRTLGNKLIVDAKYVHRGVNTRKESDAITIGFTVDAGDFEMKGDIRTIKKVRIHSFIIVEEKAAKIYDDKEPLTAVAVLDEHTCSYCSQRHALEIKDGHCPPYPENTNEEEPYDGCASESGCRCVATRKD